MKRILPIFLTVYVIISQNGETIKAQYGGMERVTVESLLSERSGATYEIVDKAAFDAIPDVRARTPEEIARAVAIARARTILTDDKQTTDERLKALIKYLDLDK